MELNDFSIGDRVEVIEEEDTYVTPGTTGTVRGIGENNEDRIQVEIDKEFSNDHLHTCDGVIPSKRGWDILPHKLRLIKQKQEIKLTKSKREAKIKKIIKEIKGNKDYSSCFKDVNKELNEWTDQQINNW